MYTDHLKILQLNLSITDEHNRNFISPSYFSSGTNVQGMIAASIGPITVVRRSTRRCGHLKRTKISAKLLVNTKREIGPR